MHEMFSSGILNWDFNSSFTESFKMNDISSKFENGKSLFSQHLEESGIDVDSDTGVIFLDLFDLVLIDTDGGLELFSESVVVIFHFSSFNGKGH